MTTTHRRDFAFAFSLTLLSSACGGSAASPPRTATEPTTSSVNMKLNSALAGPQRTEKERARDRYRHPLETLEFFGIREDSNVVELAAGQGWYTAVLAPLVADKGKLSVTSSDPNGPPDSEGTKGAKQLAERFTKDPASFGKVSTLVVDWKQDFSFGPPGSADTVLTFRNLHGWIRDGVIQKVMAASFRVLKSGGTLGIEEHRARPDGSTDPKVIGDIGYVPEPYVIQLAEQAGFKLAGKSEINANPKDTKDYPKGVWTLPPTLRLGDVDQEKYVAIGESDRMTLKFVKP
jgi:predicted methyltransferase